MLGSLFLGGYMRGVGGGGGKTHVTGIKQCWGQLWGLHVWKLLEVTFYWMNAALVGETLDLHAACKQLHMDDETDIPEWQDMHVPAVENSNPKPQKL